MRLLSRMSVPVALLAVAMAGPAVASAHGGQGSSRGPEHVYLDGNTAGANTIAGFVRHADGSLTALPGSPFQAGGAGLGAGVASQDAVKFADNGRYLLAVDAGSNQISVLSVGSDGSLTPVPGSPFSSGGVEPNSIAVHDGLVYVSNLGSAAAAQLHRLLPDPVGPAAADPATRPSPCRPGRTPATSSSTTTGRSSSAPSSAGRLRAARSSTASVSIGTER